MNTLYNLSGFFRSLGTDASIADTCAFQLLVLSRESLVRLRDCALDFVRIIELAISAKDDASEPCGDCGAIGVHHCPAWCDVPNCDTESLISSCNQRTR